MIKGRGRPLSGQDILRLGLIAFFAGCTGWWADWMVLRILGAAVNIYYSAGFIVALGRKGLGKATYE